MKKTLIALIAITLYSTVALADRDRGGGGGVTNGGSPTIAQLQTQNPDMNKCQIVEMMIANDMEETHDEYFQYEISDCGLAK